MSYIYQEPFHRCPCRVSHPSGKGNSRCSLRLRHRGNHKCLDKELKHEWSNVSPHQTEDPDTILATKES